MEDNQDDIAIPTEDDSLHEADYGEGDAKAKKMKNYIFMGVVLVIFVVGGLLAFSSMNGGDDFAVQGGPPPLPASNSQPGPQQVNQADGSQQPAEEPAPQSDPLDPFNGAAPEIEASTFDVLDEVATEDPFDVTAEVREQSPGVEMVDDSFPNKQEEVTSEPDLPRPDVAVVQDRVRNALPDSYDGMGPQGFCLGEDEIASLIDDRLDSRLAPMMAAVNALDNKLDGFEISFAERMDALEAMLNKAVKQVSKADVGSQKVASTEDSSESKSVGDKYFRVIGAMRGVAWLAVKGGDPVKLSEGDILKGFGVIEKISADGSIWSVDGRVPTKTFR